MKVKIDHRLLTGDFSFFFLFRWIGGTLMEPTFARRVFPCFDEPQYKATFQFAVGHHRSNRAISNTPQTSSVAMYAIKLIYSCIRI